MAKMMIRRVGILSSAKMSGIVGAGLGLIIGVIYGLLFMVIGAAALSGRNGPGAGFGIVGGLLMMVVIPVMYGVLSFVIGAIYALIYNAAAGFVGGVELELEEMGGGYGTPPLPPQSWQTNQYEPGRQQQQTPYSDYK